MEVALQWLKNARGVMSEIENTQQENITKAATVMADAIEKGHWVHTFGCGHATIPSRRPRCTPVRIPGKGRGLRRTDNEGLQFQ